MNFTLQAQIGVLFSRKSNTCEVLKNLDIFSQNKSSRKTKGFFFYTYIFAVTFLNLNLS